MKINIKHISNTYNYGSLMMAISTINYINKNLENVEFYVDCNTDMDLERLKRETGIENIKMQYKFESPTGNIVKKMISKQKTIREKSKKYDLLIILGGDDISEYYGKKRWLIGFINMYVENIQLPTILLGQTIGPFTSYRRLLARIALNKSKIYTRDDKCFNYLKTLGIKTANKGRDLAFLELPMQGKALGILDKYKLISNRYVTVVPSGLTRCYTLHYNNYLREQYEIIKNLINNNYLKDKKIVLLAHVKDREAPDKKVIEDLEKLLNDEEKSRIIVIKEDILASEARGVLGNSLFTITGRMHAAVSTFYMRKPAISLSYSVKYEGVIGSGLSMEELVVEASYENLWSKKEISKTVDQKVEYILENYDYLVSKIDREVTKTSKMVNEQLENLLKEIKDISQKR